MVFAVAGAGVAVGHKVASGQAASAGLLVQGSKGPAVSDVQRALGMPAAAVDGYFGDRTETNVRLFQRRHGLLVDGVVGPQTRRALGLAGAAPASNGDVPVSPDPPTGTRTSAAAAPGGLQRIARCESGGNPRAVGAGGKYRGKYQFTRETWRALGGSGDPAAAPEAEQDRRAATLYRRSGSSPWPSCG